MHNDLRTGIFHQIDATISGMPLETAISICSLSPIHIMLEDPLRRGLSYLGSE